MQRLAALGEPLRDYGDLWSDMGLRSKRDALKTGIRPPSHFVLRRIYRV
jgi:hypothetical protein